MNNEEQIVRWSSIDPAASRPPLRAAFFLLYGVEVKFYSARLNLMPALETEVRNFFAAVDGAGVTQGLIQASISSVVTAREVLKRFEG